MDWFKRKKPGFLSQKKKEMPDGLWVKCAGCGEILYRKQLAENFHVCTYCDFHFRMQHPDYVRLLLDPQSFNEIDTHIEAVDFLNFKDSKRYEDRIKAAQKATGLRDAVRTGCATICNIPVLFGVMDFRFIGGSMGSVVGEKLARAIDQARTRRQPFVLVCASGGARMQESIVSLMQMAKISAGLARFSDAGGLYVPILTHPTTGGVAASFAMLGDIHIAEPGALIGFAGERVIKKTIGEELPEGFQRAQFQLEHGFVDMIVPRKEMRETLEKVLKFFID